MRAKPPEALLAITMATECAKHLQAQAGSGVALCLRGGWAGLAALSLTALGDRRAEAAEIDGRAQCSAVRSIFDAQPPDLAAVRDTVAAIEQVMGQLDAQRAKAGQSRVYAKLSAEGRESDIAAVIATCAEYPTETVGGRARAVLETFASLFSLGRE
jgi:hypothetical protein